MKDLRFLLTGRYSNSRALIIGIDKYQSTSPLSYAVSDASTIRELLVKDFDFPEENIRYLTDEEATRDNILQAFMAFSDRSIDLDERILVFYAGHGHTVTGYRGEVGYLVPHDANPEDLSTLIRWDEFTRNSDLIRAKHLLFIMDACYGGLALTRGQSSGATRFLKDMFLRYSRQVLTAGKADEVVADAGGPIPEHSVFTGHLIEGLQGKAATQDGVISANSLMSYVFSKVSFDKNSHQTPHYGYFDGDGDFIFKAPELSETELDEKKDSDRLIIIPPDRVDVEVGDLTGKIEKCKRLLADESSSILLHDFLMDEVKRFLAATNEDNFGVRGQFSKDELLDRISRYEEAGFDLSLITSCVAYWSKPSHFPLIQKIFARTIDRLESQGGLVAWISLRWFPIILTLYCAGIAAVESRRYDALAALFTGKVQLPDHGREGGLVVDAVSSGILELNRANVFKQVPGHERNYTPMSEYLFKELQPKLDDTLFLGKGYENAFDEFEVLFALCTADVRFQRDSHVWGPLGRFGWKHQSHREGGPFEAVVEDAKSQGQAWPPLQHGLFGGDSDRFMALAVEFRKVLDGLNWW